MTKREKNIAWAVACGMMTKAEAARKLKMTNVGVNGRLFNALAAELKDRDIIKT